MSDTLRKYLVIADDSPECRVAARIAARRARHSAKGRVTLLAVIEPSHFHHWLGVNDAFSRDESERREALLDELSAIVAEEIEPPAERIVVEGELRPEIRRLVETDPEIKVLVLGAATDRKGPGPLISAFARSNFAFGSRHIPVLVVPGDLTPELIRDLA